MVEGICAIGWAVLRENSRILDALVRQSNASHLVLLELNCQPPALRVSVREVDEKLLRRVLWVGNADRNKPQDRVTSDKTEYLASQTIPNLIRQLPPRDLGSKLRKLRQAVYVELFSGTVAVWNLPGLGIADPRLVKNTEQQQEVEMLCKSSGAGFLTKEFLEAYADQKGDKKEAVKLVGEVVKAWALKELGLRSNEPVLFTLQLDGKLLAEHPEYADYLEEVLVKENEAFEGAVYGVCHVCGKYGEVTADTKCFDLLKFYNTDKLGFASGLSPGGYVRNYAMCRECYRNLLAGERFVQNHLEARLGGRSVYVVPVFHLPGLWPVEGAVREWAECLKLRVSASETLEGWHEFQRKLEDYRDLFVGREAGFVLNFLFVSRVGAQTVKVDRLIRDVPPSRLDRLDAARDRTLCSARLLLGDSPQWDLRLKQVFDLLPARKERNRVEAAFFLELLDALLTERPVLVAQLVPLFTEVARAHRFRHAGYVRVRAALEQKQRDLDLQMCVYLLQSQLLLRYLGELGLLVPCFVGGDLMEIEQQALDGVLQEYMRELRLSPAQRGLFLLGCLVGRIGSTEEQLKSGKPILNKVNFHGMDRGKVVRLANEVYEKLRQYRVADWHAERVYAAMKALLDRTLGELPSPQEVAYWVLSGYAYATWQAMRHGKMSVEVGGNGTRVQEQ